MQASLPCWAEAVEAIKTNGMMKRNLVMSLRLPGHQLERVLMRSNRRRNDFWGAIPGHRAAMNPNLEIPGTMLRIAPE